MTDDRDHAPPAPPAEPGGTHEHADVESTIDVDPSWIAALRAGAGRGGDGDGGGADGGDDRGDAGGGGDGADGDRADGGDGRAVAGGGDASFDAETTIDASDDLLRTIRAHAGTTPVDPVTPVDPPADEPATVASMPAPDLSHLPPPPNAAPPARTEPAPAAAAVAVATSPSPAVSRWTPSDRLASRSPVTFQPVEGTNVAAPHPTPWKAVAAAVIATAAVLLGAWALFGRSDDTSPFPPDASVPVATDDSETGGPVGDAPAGDGPAGEGSDGEP